LFRRYLQFLKFLSNHPLFNLVLRYLQGLKSILRRKRFACEKMHFGSSVKQGQSVFVNWRERKKQQSESQCQYLQCLK
jgi:hypothetical protein